MKITNFRKSLSAIGIYILLALWLFLDDKFSELIKHTLNSQYSFIKIVVFILISALIGVLCGIISEKEVQNRTVKILDFVIIVIPSIFMILSKFLLMNNTYAKIMPDIVKADNGILIIVGAIMIGCMLYGLFRKKQNEKS